MIKLIIVSTLVFSLGLLIWFTRQQLNQQKDQQKQDEIDLKIQEEKKRNK